MKQRRLTRSANWQKYCQEKARLDRKNLPASEYERQIRLLALRLGV